MKCFPGTKVALGQSPKVIRDAIRITRQATHSMLRGCETRKEKEAVAKESRSRVADLEKALPLAEARERIERMEMKEILAKAEIEREEALKEKIEMASKKRKAAKKAVAEKAIARVAEATAKAAVPEKATEAVETAKEAAATKTKKETYQDSILIIMDGKDMPYASIMKAVIDRRVEANLMDRPTGPNGACGAALKKLVLAGTLTQPTRGVYAVAKA